MPPFQGLGTKSVTASVCCEEEVLARTLYRQRELPGVGALITK